MVGVLNNPIEGSQPTRISWFYDLSSFRSRWLWSIEIVDLGIENGGSFQLAMLNYQRVAIEKLQTDYLYLIYPLKMVISMVMLPEGLGELT